MSDSYRRERTMASTPFTQWLERQMAENGLSLAELARRLGLKASSSVGDWRRGNSYPRPEHILALAKEFRTAPETILRLIAGVPVGSPVDERRERLARLALEVEDSDLEVAEKLLRVYAEKRAR
jgi:transcriptional regulator with XRE-family HTH domain